MQAPSRKYISATFTIVLALNVMIWLSVRDVRAKWLNVPPVPSLSGAASFGIGDQQFAYRVIGIMLQNLGDTGGNSTPLKNYNYDDLARWFFLADKLDPQSNFIPFLAAYYFGAVQDPEKLSPLIEYLRVVGNRPEGQKWRWLAQAVNMEMHGVKDLDKAYELARELADLSTPDMPEWTRQMPVFVLKARGDNEAAYDVMLEILKSSASKLDPAEVNYMRDYMCNTLLPPEKAKDNPLCQNIP